MVTDRTGTAQEPLGKLLRCWRLAAGLSQEGLAERAGLSAKAIAQLETGKRTAPRAETLRLLAEALELGAAERTALALSARRGTFAVAGRPGWWHPAHARRAAGSATAAGRT